MILLNLLYNLENIEFEIRFDLAIFLDQFFENLDIIYLWKRCFQTFQLFRWCVIKLNFIGSVRTLNWAILLLIILASLCWTARGNSLVVGAIWSITQVKICSTTVETTRSIRCKVCSLIDNLLMMVIKLGTRMPSLKIIEKGLLLILIVVFNILLAKCCASLVDSSTQLICLWLDMRVTVNGLLVDSITFIILLVCTKLTISNTCWAQSSHLWLFREVQSELCDFFILAIHFCLNSVFCNEFVFHCSCVHFVTGLALHRSHATELILTHWVSLNLMMAERNESIYNYCSEYISIGSFNARNKLY